MAFTGVATIKKVAENLFRITGLSLAAGAAGTISVDAGAGEVKLDAPEWGGYDTAGQQGGAVTLADAIQVEVVSADAAGTAVEDVAVVKTGTLPADFLATLTNKDVAASGALEIYVRYH